MAVLYATTSILVVDANEIQQYIEGVIEALSGIGIWNG